MLGDGVDLVIKPPAEALEQMDDFVRSMHTTSGLLDELDAGHRRWRRPQEQVLAYVREWVPDARKAPLGGNTVADRPGLPGPGHARAGVAPALPDHRRVLDQGARPVAGTRGPTSTPPPSTVATGRWRTSGSRSPSCATTAKRCSCPRPAPTRTPPRRSRPGTSWTTTSSGVRWGPVRVRLVGMWSRTGPDRGGHEHPGGAGTIVDACTAGLSPVVSHGGRSSAGRAPRCGRGGRGFKPRRSPQTTKAPDRPGRGPSSCPRVGRAPWVLCSWSRRARAS